MTRLNPDKLLLSKWTATAPRDREKHFLVTRILRDAHDRPVACVLEAIYSRRAYEVDWRLLRDSARWLQGWR